MLIRIAVAVVGLSIAVASPSAFAKDDLLETLAQKGIITMAEYEKLRARQGRRDDDDG